MAQQYYCYRQLECLPHNNNTIATNINDLIAKTEHTTRNAILLLEVWWWGGVIDDTQTIEPISYGKLTHLC